MKTKQSGFTLVEILIVVVILGILAAIVIPQFTDASTQAKVSSCKSDLQSVRSQIQLYKIQHNDYYPGTSASGTQVGFVLAMTAYTLIDGATSSAGVADTYGPYLQQMPTNPWNNSSAITGTGAGWSYSTTTGAFAAADGGTEGCDPLDPLETHATW